MANKKLNKKAGGEVVSDLEKFEYFFSNYWRQVTLGACVLVVVAVAIFAFTLYRGAQSRKADSLLIAAKTEVELLAALDRHPSASAACFARLQLARIYLAETKYDQAILQYEMIARDRALPAEVRNRAQLDRVYLMEMSGDLAGAAEQFARLGDDRNLNDAMRSEANYSAGRLLFKNNDPAGALIRLEMAKEAIDEFSAGADWGRNAESLEKLILVAAKSQAVNAE